MRSSGSIVYFTFQTTLYYVVIYLFFPGGNWNKCMQSFFFVLFFVFNIFVIIVTNATLKFHYHYIFVLRHILSRCVSWCTKAITVATEAWTFLVITNGNITLSFQSETSIKYLQDNERKLMKMVDLPPRLKYKLLVSTAK